MSSQGSSSSRVAIFTLDSPTISTPSSFSIFKYTSLPFIFTSWTVGCFKLLTIISLSLVRESTSFTLKRSNSWYVKFLVVTAVFESLSYEYHTLTSKFPFTVTSFLLLVPLNVWLITQQPNTVLGVFSGVRECSDLKVFLPLPTIVFVTILGFPGMIGLCLFSLFIL